MALNSEPTRHAESSKYRIELVIACIGVIAYGISAIVYFLYAYTSGIPNLYWNAVLQVPSIVAWLYAVSRVVKRAGGQRAFEIGFALLFIIAPLNSVFFAGTGLVVGLGTGIAVVAAAGLVLPPRRAQWFILAAIISAILAFLFDLFGSPERPSAPLPNNVNNVIVGVATLIVLSLLLTQFRNFSLRTKLIVAFVSVALLIALFITALTTQGIRAASTESTARDLRTRAQAAALAIGITMDRNVDRVQTLTFDKSIQDALTVLTDSYPANAAERDAARAQNAARWASADAQDSVIRDALNGKMAASLRRFGEVYSGNKELFITDPYGAVVAATDWSPNYDYSKENWWQIAYNNGRGSVYIGQPEFDPMISEYGVRIALPVYVAGTRRAVGVVHSIFTMVSLQRALLLNSFGQTGKIDLLFPQGQILTSDGTFRALSPEEFEEIKDGIGASLTTLNYRGTPLLSGQGVVGVSDEQPEPYLRSSAWRTIATIQEEEALGVVEAGVQGAALAGVGAVGAALVVALLLAQLLTRPIRRLTAVVEEIQTGDLAARARVESGDEIGVLARSFNAMTARLQDTLSGLERRVTERTQELSQANLNLQANSAYLSALSDTSAGLFERLNLNDLLQAIVERAGALVGTQHGFVFYADPGDSEIQMRVGLGVYDDLVGTRAQAGVGLAGSVWQSGQPMVIEDYQKWEGRLPGSRRDALRAIVAVPLKRGAGQGSQDDETVGVIGLAYTNGERKFGKTEIEILQRFAQLASIALDNAELYANSENRVQELAALNSIGQLVVQQGEFETIVERVGEEIRRIFDADFGYFALYNPDTNQIEFPYVVDDGKRIQIEPLAMGEGITSQIISTGQPVLLAHATQDDYERIGAIDSGDGSSPHSLLAVPIRVGENNIGALSVQRVALDRPFTKDDANLLTTIATNVGVGIDNVRLALATKRRVAELSAVNRVGTILNGAESLESRLKDTGRELVSIFGVSSVYISLYEQERDFVHMPFFIEEGVESEIPSTPRGTGFVSHIIKTNQPLVINHELLKRFEELGGVWIGDSTVSPNSYLGVPISAGDQVLGVVALNAIPEGRFTSGDVSFLSTIAGVLASAIQNDRLSLATRQRLAELAALNKISAILTSDRALTGRLSEVGQELHTIFDVESVYVALYDAATNIVRMPFFRGDGQEFVIEPFELGPGFTSHIIKTREALLINDDLAAQMQALQAMNAGEEDTTQAYLGVPVRLGDEVLGVIGLSSETKNKFHESDIRLLNTIAAAVASAIQNTRLLEQTQERARELDAVNSLAREITQQRSLDDLFQEVYFQVKTVTSADGLLVSLYDDRTNTLTVPFLLDEGQRYEITPDALAMEQDYAGQVRMGEPVMINSTPEEVAELEKSPAVAGNGRASRSRLYVPLMAGVRFLGMISLHSYEYNAYTQRDAAVLSGLASHIAVALENARLFEQTQKALAETADQARRLALLNQASAELTRGGTFEDIVRITDHSINEVLAADRVTFALILPDGSGFQIYGVQGEVGVLPVGTIFPMVGTMIADMVRDQAVVYAADIVESYNTPAMRPLIELDLRSIISAPLISGGRVVGALNVSSKKPNQYSERDVNLAVQLASLSGSVLENQRLLDQTQAALGETNRLYRIAEAANIETDEASFYRRLQEIVGDAMYASNLYIALYNPSDATIDIAYYVDEKDVLPEVPQRRLNVGTGVTAYVLRTRQPLLASKAEVHALAEKGELKLHGGTSESWLGVPMLRGDTPMGVIAVQSYDATKMYTERDKQTLVNLSQGIANAIERRRAEDALRRSEAQLAETMRLTHLGNWEYDVARDIFTFTDEFYAMMRTNVEREGGYTMSSTRYAERFVYPEDGPLVGREVQSALETTDPNYLKEIDHRVFFGDGELGYVTVRIRVRKDSQGRTFQTYGANLDITDRKRAESELQIALAETQRLAAQARDAADQVTALNRRLTREGWRDYLQQINSRIVVESGGTDDGNGHASAYSERMDGAPMGEAAGNGDGTNGHPIDLTESGKIRVPIQLRGEVIGEIELEPEEAAPPMSQEDLGLVTHVAENIGLALDNARLFTETQRRVTELDALNSITQAVTTELDLDSLLTIIGDQLRTIFDVQNTYLALYDRETQMISLPYFVNDNQRVIVDPIPYGEGITSHIIRTRQALVINDHTDQAMEKLGAKVFGKPALSYLGVPIFVGEQVTGAISIQSTAREGLFDESNVRLMETIAATVGAAIQNAQLWGAMHQEVITRQRAEEEIKLSLKEKEVLLKEIHHRVKNNLQIITSLLNLQSAQIKDPDAIMLFRESQSRVRSMALIHEKLYQSKDLARIDFDGYLRDLMVYLFRSYAANPDQIRSHVTAENMFLTIDTAIPCGLIISELVTNTIKYAFPDGKRGNLHVSVAPEDDGHLTLLVKDDGVGFREGFDWRESDSLGLQLVSTLSSQLHGTIDVDGTHGTSFKITFPG